jgi:integrase
MAREAAPPKYFRASVRKTLHSKRAPLAARTIWNAASIVRVFFADALERKKIARDPTEGWRAEKHLPPKTDKVRGWRQRAGFSLEQVVTLTTDRRVREDRRILYALRFLGGGLRPGEAANARWRDLDIARQPLARLTLASAFNTLMHEEKDTKTGAELNIPVHPVLAAALDAWRAEGWERFIGRVPKTDDLIVPRQDGTQRLVTTSNGHFHTDLAAVGLPEQRQYESRSTFRNLALQAGASEFHVNLITHPKPAKAADFYTRLEMQWPAMCEAVLRIDARAWAARTVVESSASANEAPLAASSATPANEAPAPAAANAPDGWLQGEVTVNGTEMKNPCNWTGLQGSKLVTRTGLEPMFSA